MQDTYESVRSNEQPTFGQQSDKRATSIAASSAAHSDSAHSRNFIFLGIIELALRRSIEDASSQGISPIRVAMLAAQIHGRKWFSVSDVFKQLTGVGKEPPTKSCAQRMENLGLTETRKKVVDGKQIYQSRLRNEVILFDENHIHGQTAIRFANDIDIFYASRPNASGLAGLLLVGIHVTRLTNSADLRRFCEPQHSYEYLSSLTSRILTSFEDEGMVAVIRRSGMSNGFTVLPVRKAA